MEIKFKTSKSNAYVIENGLKKIEKIEKFNFDKTLILANSTVTDSDIVVITYGFSDEKILFQTSDFIQKMPYDEIGEEMRNYFPSLNKVSLICCYNACMKDAKIKHILITIPEGIRTFYTIDVKRIYIDPLTKCINILFNV